MSHDDLNYLDMIDQTTDVLSEEAFKKVTASGQTPAGPKSGPSQPAPANPHDAALEDQFGLRLIDNPSKKGAPVLSDPQNYFDLMHKDGHDDEKAEILNELYSSLIQEKQRSESRLLEKQLASRLEMVEARKTLVQNRADANRGFGSDPAQPEQPIKDLGLNEDEAPDYLKEAEPSRPSPVPKTTNSQSSLDQTRPKATSKVQALAEKFKKPTRENSPGLSGSRGTTPDKRPQSRDVLNVDFAPNIIEGVRKLKPVYSNVKFNPLETQKRPSAPEENRTSSGQRESPQGSPVDGATPHPPLKLPPPKPKVTPEDSENTPQVFQGVPKKEIPVSENKKSSPTPANSSTTLRRTSGTDEVRSVITAPPSESQQTAGTPLNDKIKRLFQALPDDDRIRLEIEYKQHFMEIMNDLFSNKKFAENSETSRLLKQKMAEMVSVEFLFYCSKLSVPDILKVIRLQRFYRKRIHARISQRIRESDQIFQKMKGDILRKKATESVDRSRRASRATLDMD